MLEKRSLLLSEPLPESAQDRAHNLINGSDAESFALAKFVLACRGEGQWGSREEDNSKIDLIISCEHPWYLGERLMVLVQVKSGATYGKISDNGFTLHTKAKVLARRTSHAICFVWVDRDTNQAFWAWLRPGSSIAQQEYSRHQKVNPSIVYDLARCMSIPRRGRIGAKGIIVKRTGGEIKERRRKARAKYRSISKVLSPVFGEISLSRLGWRHMFRSGRRRANKESSLDIIPYLGHILKRWPSSHAITANERFECNGFTYRVTEHLLKFSELRVSLPGGRDRGDQVAHVRIVEEIRYPRDWESRAMTSQLVSRRVAIKSAYWKANSKNG